MLGLWPITKEVFSMTDDQAKETNMTVRVPVGMRKHFAAVCKSRDQSVSQTIRNMMREHIRKYGQADLFKDGGD